MWVNSLSETVGNTCWGAFLCSLNKFLLGMLTTHYYRAIDRSRFAACIWYSHGTLTQSLTNLAGVEFGLFLASLRDNLSMQASTAVSRFEIRNWEKSPRHWTKAAAFLFVAPAPIRLFHLTVIVCVCSQATEVTEVRKPANKTTGLLAKGGTLVQATD